MRSNKNIAQLSNESDTSQKDNIYITDVTGVVNLINKGDALVKFYSKGCPHCTAMIKEWDKLIQLNSDEPQHAIISIESNFMRNPEIAALLTKLNIHVSGFPTIVFINKNKLVINYEGPRKALDMNAFIINNSTNSKSIKSGGYNSSKKHNVKRRKTKRTNKTKRRNKTKRGGCACGM